jgi:hypothetical protein
MVAGPVLRTISVVVGIEEVLEEDEFAAIWFLIVTVEHWLPATT